MHCSRNSVVLCGQQANQVPQVHSNMSGGTAKIVRPFSSLLRYLSVGISYCSPRLDISKFYMRFRKPPVNARCAGPSF